MPCYFSFLVAHATLTWAHKDLRRYVSVGEGGVRASATASGVPDGFAPELALAYRAPLDVPLAFRGSLDGRLSALRFRSGSDGKLAFADQQAKHFSLSHSDGLVVCCHLQHCRWARGGAGSGGSES